MAILQIPDKRPHPQSVGNLALAQVTLEALHMPTREAEQGPLPVTRDERQEVADDDPLGPARGIANALRLSVTLWSFIALVVLLMR